MSQSFIIPDNREFTVEENLQLERVLHAAYEKSRRAKWLLQMEIEGRVEYDRRTPRPGIVELDLPIIKKPGDELSLDLIAAHMDGLLKNIHRLVQAAESYRQPGQATKLVSVHNQLAFWDYGGRGESNFSLIYLGFLGYAENV